jgi:quercetin dioxygenase-like cupin family protein
MAKFHMADEAAFQEVDPGVFRRMRTHTDNLMMVEIKFNKGAVGSEHTHPHEQQTYILEGRFRFSNDGETREVGPGDTICFAPNVKHGTVCLEAGRLIDVFSPARKDFL